MSIKSFIKENLESIFADKESYDIDSQVYIESLVFQDKEIGMLNNMKKTEGWKLLEVKIREELQTRIREMVKDDPQIKTLLTLLNVADVKTLSQSLEEEIKKILPS